MDFSKANFMGRNERKREITVLYVGAANSDVVFSSDNDVVIKVNKQKLFEKSAYFRALFKTCYKDHQSDLMKVIIPVSCEVFKIVMEFINTDTITLDVKTLTLLLLMFETYHLALYLQIDILSEFCLDHFTYNLNQNTLESQLHIMKDELYLEKEFIKRANMFKVSERQFFTGFYILQDKKEEEKELGSYLKVFSKDFKSLHVLSELKHDNIYTLQYFDFMLWFIVRDGIKWYLSQYNLLSGNILKNVKCYYGYNKPIICFNSKNLFVISENKKKRKYIS